MDFNRLEILGTVLQKLRLELSGVIGSPRIEKRVGKFVHLHWSSLEWGCLHWLQNHPCSHRQIWQLTWLLHNECLLWWQSHGGHVINYWVLDIWCGFSKCKLCEVGQALTLTTSLWLCLFHCNMYQNWVDKGDEKKKLLKRMLTMPFSQKMWGWRWKITIDQIISRTKWLIYTLYVYYIYTI